MRCARRVTCPHREGRFVRCLVNGLKGGLACVESDTAKVLVPRSPLLQPDLVERHQRDDPLWQQLIEYLEEGRLPPRRIPLPLDQFELRDRVLYHVKSNNERAMLQLVIPRSLCGAALDAVHAVPSAGHQGVHRTYQRLRDHFYFPGMLAASRRYVTSCTACQRRKGAIARTPLQSMPDVAEPFERVSVDILTLTPSACGNKSVLVLIDHLTRFVELFAQTVADVFLAEFVTRRDSHFPLVGSNHVIYAEGALPSLRSKLRAAGEAARKARERWTADHDRRRRARPREYNEGDLVFVHRSVILHPSHGTRPLGPRWLGPVRVLKKLGPVAYVVRRPNSDGQEVTLHPNKFKAFRVTAEFVPPDNFPRLDGTAPPDPESDMGPLQDPGADNLLDSESSARHRRG
ncbi:putative armadillo repeat-containing protein 8 [Penaeus vannamei]|uniref:RNA-directed DNA polymerase n=1 Tax=Penaeus vannamei TaxID=6689 RepID=A0A423U997_PENVA|nr:putative armadillo repeat-containing protein 8 [Penaeus vannamei]